MLVMLAPSFDGSNEAYARLVKATGMLAYDLKSRIKPGVWGVVRALADEEEAHELTQRLLAEGLPALIVPREVAHDPNRRIVTIRALELSGDHMVLHLREREMAIPFGALTCIVRGEVLTGHVPSRAGSPSSATFRAVAPSTGDVQVFRESVSASNFDAYAAADLHFANRALGGASRRAQLRFLYARPGQRQPGFGSGSAGRCALRALGRARRSRRACLERGVDFDADGERADGWSLACAPLEGIAER